MQAIKQVTLWRNIKWGISWGLALAFFYCLYVIVLFLFRESQPFDDKEISLPAVLAVYVFGGIAGGIVVGLLRPLAKNRLAAMLIGIVAAAPLIYGAVFAMAGLPSSWDKSDIFAARASTIIAGVLGGYIAWGWRDRPRKWQRRS